MRQWIIELRVVANDDATAGGFDVSRTMDAEVRAELAALISAADQWSADEVRLGLRIVEMPPKVTP